MAELFEKLAHPLAEVRRRALRSLLFKQKHGLLAATDVGAALPHVVAALDLSCPAAAAGDSTDALALVQLLDSLALSSQSGTGAAHALHCGADQALIRLAEAAPACTALASALLGNLLCTRGEAGGADSMLAPRTAGKPSPGSNRAASASPASSRQALQGGSLQTATALPSSNLPPSPPTALWPSPPSGAFPASPGMRATAPDAWPICASGSCVLPESLPRSAAAEALSEEDQQQLFEVALELGTQRGGAPADEPALLATLATLRHGVLSDMPAAAVAGEPALAASLLRLLEAVDPQPLVAVAALHALQALAAQLGASQLAGHAAASASSEAAGQLEESRDVRCIAALAREGLLRCARLCSDARLQHAALPAAAALVPLLRLPAGRMDVARRLLAPLLDTLADALHLSLVADCTSADLPPPSDWAAGWHAMVLGPGSCGILRLLVQLLERVLEILTAQALPPILCDIWAALACSPVAAVAAPDLHVFAQRHLPSVHPACVAQLETVANLQGQQAGLLAAVQQLAAAPSAALVAACCREVHQRLPALALLPVPTRHKAVALLIGAAGRHAAVPHAARLAAALLLHTDASVRQAALEAAGQLDRSAATSLVCCESVAGSLVLTLGDAPPRQQLAASLLQAVAAAAGELCGQAFQAWQVWLHCHAGQAAAGPAVAALLQAAAANKCTTWQRSVPLLLALFHSHPAAASAAAAELHGLLVHHRPSTAGAMLYCPLPFDGLLLPAGSLPSHANNASMTASKAAASAAKLFTASDVQSLLAVVGNAGLPAELAAAALGQLAHVAGDGRFAAILANEQVLGMLLGHALDASSLRRVQQPALECLVAVLEQQPRAADWLRAEPEGRLVPLLPLVFHPLAASREMVARLLHHLLFAAATRQMDGLMADVQAIGVAGSSINCSLQCTGQGVPDPFCAVFCFPVPTAVVPVWAEAQRSADGSSSGSSIFDAFGGSKPVQRLWQAQQMCAAAAAAEGDASNNSLLELLASLSTNALPRWQIDLVQSSLATLRNLQTAAAASNALASLASSQDHEQCRAALHRLALLAVPGVMPEGLAALAASPWLPSLRFLLTAAPLSAADCCLWMQLLPLLPQLLQAAPGQQGCGQSVTHHLQTLAEQFVGGSALAWVQQQAAEAQPSHVQAALLPEALHTVRRLVDLGMLHSSYGQRQQLLAAMRGAEWLELLPKQLASGSYASRVAALRLAAALVGSHAGCLPAGPLAGRLFAATVRQVLMPRHLWGTQHRHGKAAVLAALELLHFLTQSSPVHSWAAAWAELGTTYWLSRATDDSSPAVRTAAMRLLAAALAAPATHALLQAAWPECGASVVDAALAAEEKTVAVRAAALSAVAALLSHGPSHHCQLGCMPAGSTATEPKDEAAVVPTDLTGTPAVLPAVLPADQECVLQAERAREDAGKAVVPALADGAANGSQLQLAVLPPLAPHPLSAETFLQHDELWDGVRSVLQEASDPRLLSAAAHAALQRALLDTDGADVAADTALLQRLLQLPADVAAGLVDPAPVGFVCKQPAESAMLAALQAAQAAASLLVVRCQLQGPPCSDLLPTAAAAFTSVVAASSSSLPELAAPAADAVRRACWAALPVMADALTSQASAPLTPSEVQAACSSCPQPLAVAIAAALAGPPGGPNMDSCCTTALNAALCRLLAVLLQREDTACSFLLATAEHEHAVPAPADSHKTALASKPVGAVLCTHLIELFVEAAAAEAAPQTSSGGLDAAAQPCQQSAVLRAALGGLLAHSPSAKQVALDVGFHASLLETCCRLAACSPLGDGHGGPAAVAEQASVPAEPEPCSRGSKLQKLKQRRSGGKCHLAFGSRAPSRGTNSRLQAGRFDKAPSPAATEAAEETSSAQAVPPVSACLVPGSASMSSRGQQRLLQLLALLQRLVAGSPAACDAVGAAGLLQLAGALLQPWEAATLPSGGAAQVPQGMLRLLGSVLASSEATRNACANDGDAALMERLVAMLLSARTPLPVAGAVAGCLRSFAGTPDGAHALVHTASLPVRALRHVQDGMASKDWRRLGPVLQLLAGLCSQPEGQRAVLRCSAPSGDLLGALLGLAVPGSRAQVPASGSTAVTASAEAAMLVIRQLALHPQAKAHLVANRHGVLQSLVGCIGAASAAHGSAGTGAAQPQRAAAAAHALWVLVHGSGGERAKAALRRCPGWEGSLREGLAAAELEPQAGWSAVLKDACTVLLRLLA